MSPSVTSSSPAIMRNKVDLPQPDAPRNTQNSPSVMSRSISRTMGGLPPYALDTPFSTTLAIPVSV
ncbi:hypothetical protein Y024_5162 [Burkholderia pseudomallei TSV44]|nr:hypothetical protein Y024_5162 [Burkholderia pseudomallei TSV44]